MDLVAKKWSLEQVASKVKTLTAKNAWDVDFDQLFISLGQGVDIYVGLNSDLNGQYLNDFDVTECYLVEDGENILDLPSNLVIDIVAEVLESYCAKKGITYNVDNAHFEALSWLETCRSTDQWLKSQAI